MGVATLLCLAAGPWADLGLARAKRLGYRYGDDVVWGTVADSVAAALGARDATPSPDEPVSERDLFMLARAAEFHVERDGTLAAADDPGRLPVRYEWLDGFDVDTRCLRRALRDDLPSLAAAGAGPSAGWGVAPVVLDLPASPGLRDVLAGLIADEPALSVHTCGQVLARDVRVRGVRYALACVEESPGQRARELRELRARVAELAARAQEAAGDDDRAYVRAAFGLLAASTSYAQEESASRHANDAYGALVEGAARCYGLSGALKLVLDARGIPNYVADGTKPGGRHSWNVVRLDGSWRVCDLTLALDGDGPGEAAGGRAGHPACLAPQRGFYIGHGYVPDGRCVTLQLVHDRMVAELRDAGMRGGAVYYHR